MTRRRGRRRRITTLTKPQGSVFPSVRSAVPPCRRSSFSPSSVVAASRARRAGGRRVVGSRPRRGIARRATMLTRSKPATTRDRERATTTTTTTTTTTRPTYDAAWDVGDDDDAMGIEKTRERAGRRAMERFARCASVLAVCALVIGASASAWAGARARAATSDGETSAANVGPPERACACWSERTTSARGRRVKRAIGVVTPTR